MCKSSLPANPTVKNVIQNQWLHFGIVLAAIPEKNGTSNYWCYKNPYKFFKWWLKDLNNLLFWKNNSLQVTNLAVFLNVISDVPVILLTIIFINASNLLHFNLLFLVFPYNNTSFTWEATVTDTQYDKKNFGNCFVYFFTVFPKKLNHSFLVWFVIYDCTKLLYLKSYQI